MGRLCTFGDGSVPDEPLSKSWELCLQGLSRYTEMSSIGRKSLHLLKECAKSLLSNGDGQGVCSASRSPSGDGLTMRVRNQQKEAWGTGPPYMSNNPVEAPAADFSLRSDFDTYPLDGLGGDCGLTDDTGGLAWPFPPFPSQLEAMTFDFDSPDQTR